MQYPKNYERLVLLNLADADEGADFRPLAAGVMSRSHNLQEEAAAEFYDDDGPCAEMTALRQTRVIDFQGHRATGDAGQDRIFDALAYDTSRRAVEFIDWLPSGAAWRGVGLLTITDSGGGEAAYRQNISFSIRTTRPMRKGTLHYDEEKDLYEWEEDFNGL